MDLTVFDKVFLYKGSENEFTNMLTRLVTKKPEFFNKNGYHLGFGTVDSLCGLLRKLAQEKANTELTEENIIILTNGLKSRLLSTLIDRESNGNFKIPCTIKDIHIKSTSKFVEKSIDYSVVEGSGYLENEFTQLLGLLLEKKKRAF